jgi:hypothetical protein
VSREDTGSRTPADAARFERWRAKHDDPPADDDEGIYVGRTRYHMGYRVPTHCTCNARSEEPCSYCSWPGDEP